ncbi:MAG: hypothetical protein QM426_04925 [Euryarchaeota archaeon]|nr:hypothetical protein [Euryarchaeota archaeon]
MDIKNTSYLLNDFAPGTFKAWEKKILELNKSLRSPIELKPGDFVSVKVVDYES